MRENGSSLHLNFILLPNPAVDENWVCWHRLLQFIFWKWCCVQCSDLFKINVNGKFTVSFYFFCAQIDFLFTIFVQIDFLFTIFVCWFYRLWATFKLHHHFSFASLCANSRLCCMHFLYHWCKIHIISYELMLLIFGKSVQCSKMCSKVTQRRKCRGGSSPLHSTRIWCNFFETLLWPWACVMVTRTTGMSL